MKREFLLRIIQLLLLLLFSSHGIYASTVRADPDFISTGMEYCGVPAVKIGDNVRFGSFSLGGMVEIRNEERFNQGVFPNHNWRGFFFGSYDYQVFAGGGSSGVVTAGFEHESAHPTSGLNEPVSDPYQMIYDGTYRNINLNSILLRYCHTAGPASAGGRWAAEGQGRYHCHHGLHGGGRQAGRYHPLQLEEQQCVGLQGL